MRFHFGSAFTVLIVVVLSTVLLSLNSQAQNFARRGNAPVVSQNFIVRASDAQLARKVSSEAERFRRELAIEWLGKELPAWDQKCPITVEIGRHAGGETSFAFMTNGTRRGNPTDWRMKIFGPPDRLLDAVLPHEVTHTIFATHFGQPLPRWADEGACTTVEHASERKKNHRMLMDFLSASPSRGIPFNRMFTMRNYPHDILPLYAQGYSLAKFLILQKGKRKFLDYISEGLENETRMQELQAWNAATDDFYGYSDLSELQLAWLGWVRNGSDESAFDKLANRGTPPSTFARADTPVVRSSQIESNSPTVNASFANSDSWYAREMKRGANRVAAKRENLPSTQTKKVSSTEVKSKMVLITNASQQPESKKPVFRDSTLPRQYQPAGGTVWR
ncbi:MAG: hypothetical protein AB8B55_09300 [Mariniblastus sp.]